MSFTTVVCASRRSPLAMIQSRMVAARLAERGIATSILGVTTSGDRERDRPIDELGSINVFVTELESALRERRADYAVHSCKDLPAVLAADMRIAAFSRREDARDAFCSERYTTFDALPPGSIVGTSSPRRHTQLAHIRPDLEYRTLRGNVDTRLNKLRDGQYDAIVLAMAGLKRLGRRSTHLVPFDVERVVPAVGQGALAVETREPGEPLADVVRDAVNDASAALCISCERAALRALRAGCSAPIGIHARIESQLMLADGISILPGEPVVRARIERRVATIEQAVALGSELAEKMTLAGAATGASR